MCSKPNEQFFVAIKRYFFCFKIEKKKQNFTEGYDFNLFHIKQHILT